MILDENNLTGQVHKYGSRTQPDSAANRWKESKELAKRIEQEGPNWTCQTARPRTAGAQ